MNVQHWLPADDDTLREDASIYDAVVCPACLRLHFVNKAGRTLGDKKVSPAAS